MPAGSITPHLPPLPQPVNTYDVKFQTNPLMAAFVSLIGAGTFGYLLSFILYDRMSVQQFMLTAVLALALYHLIVALHGNALDRCLSNTLYDWLPLPQGPGRAMDPRNYRRDPEARGLQNRTHVLMNDRSKLMRDIITAAGPLKTVEDINLVMRAAANANQTRAYCQWVHEHNERLADWRARTPNY